MAMSAASKTEYVLLDAAYRIRNICKTEEDPRRQKELTRSQLWKKRKEVNKCQDCTKKLPVRTWRRFRCLLCGNVLCKGCVKPIPHYLFDLTEEEKAIKIDACGNCIVKVEEQYRKKKENNNLQEALTELEEHLEKWKATWDKYTKMKESKGKYSRSEIEEMDDELYKCIDDITNCKNGLKIDWREENGIMTTEEYHNILHRCDDIIKKKIELNLIEEKEEEKSPTLEGKKGSCCLRCIRKILCCFCVKGDSEREPEYKEKEELNPEEISMKSDSV